MCGIVGYVGTRSVKDVLLKGLKQLEYRGYDSAGIALGNSKKIWVYKSEGRIDQVSHLLKQDLPHDISFGIGHTRWATHGKATTQNAHPHRVGSLVLVHNGIVENYAEIKQSGLSKGYTPQSETDTEWIGFLIFEFIQSGLTLLEAVRQSALRLKGQSSFLVISESEPNCLIAVRQGSPLVATQDPQRGVMMASDAQPLIEFQNKVIFLEHGDLVRATKEGLEVFHLKTGQRIQREWTHLEGHAAVVEKGPFAHFMAKEIAEQPQAIVATFEKLLVSSITPFSLIPQPGLALLEQAQELIFVACGTSWHAALLGKYWIEQLAEIPVTVELASEFRYRNPVIRRGALVIGVSQSGETADTLAVLRDVRTRQIPTLGITNVYGSSITREADAIFLTAAGLEMGVAATKTLMTQLIVMILIAGYLGKSRKKDLALLHQELMSIPVLMMDELSENSVMLRQIRQTVASFQKARGFFFIGRGYSYPLALEGALKLKEIAYDFAEGYAAGELKHGPIAMIDEEMVVIVLAPRDAWRDKTVSNLEEVKARHATIVGIGDSDDQHLKSLCDHWIALPSANRSVNTLLLPLLLVPVIQCLSYERALQKGTHIDQPRNLAKSVTVE